MGARRNPVQALRDMNSRVWELPELWVFPQHSFGSEGRRIPQPPTQIPAACGMHLLSLGGFGFVGNSTPPGPPAARQRGREIWLPDYGLSLE